MRRSPKRGTLIDVFDDLLGVVRVFPHDNLEIEVLGVTIDEVRVTAPPLAGLHGRRPLPGRDP